MHPSHTFPPHVFKDLLLILSSPLRLDHPCDLSPSGFPTKILDVFFISSCMLHGYLTVLVSITITIFDEAYKLEGSSLCSLLQSPATSSLLGPWAHYVRKLPMSHIVTYYPHDRFSEPLQGTRVLRNYLPASTFTASCNILYFQYVILLLSREISEQCL
jgi:hypothetical protein